jgi:hypothetical protein
MAAGALRCCAAPIDSPFPPAPPPSLLPQALELDAGNAKARYRRAHAYAGEGSHDLALLDMQASPGRWEGHQGQQEAAKGSVGATRRAARERGAGRRGRRGSVGAARGQ